MGTDIHGVFQRRNEEGKWVDVPSEYSQDRHYFLFAWIGNVRNGFGFAGPTHAPVTPLSDRRGFPEDFEVVDEGHPISAHDIRDPRRQKYYEDEDADPADESYLKVWMGDHSHSWLSADEILTAEPPKTARTGIVDINIFRAWDGKSAPEEWCGGISGPGVQVSTPDDIHDGTTHVRIEWAEDASKSLAYFVDEVRRLKELHGEVRFVFGFDS